MYYAVGTADKQGCLNCLRQLSCRQETEDETASNGHSNPMYRHHPSLSPEGDIADTGGDELVETNSRSSEKAGVHVEVVVSDQSNEGTGSHVQKQSVDDVSKDMPQPVVSTASSAKNFSDSEDDGMPYIAALISTPVF